jgi:hypothetical protein
MISRLFAVIVWGCLFAPNCLAGPGHEHDAPPQTSGVLSPRFAAHSETLEVVGVLQGDVLLVFVDGFDDNAPVLGAKVEIESGTYRAVGTFDADHGQYSFPSNAFQGPGSYPVQITITAGTLMDLLAANLEVPDPHAGHDHPDDDALLHRWWVWLAAAAGVLILVGWMALRSRRQRRTLGVTP